MRYTEKAAPAPGADPTEFVMSDGSVDRMGDVIEPAGWQLAHFRDNPIALFNHDRNQVIGEWQNVTVKGGRLVGKLKLAAHDPDTPVSNMVGALVRQGILRAVSVGFRALQKEKLGEKADEFFGPFRFTKTELLECSLVSVPANPNALAVAKEFPRDVVAEVLSKPANELLERAVTVHGKPAKPLARHGANMTLAQKIQAAQARINGLRDQAQQLANKDDTQLSDEERKLTEELPAMLEAEQRELARLEGLERTLAPRPATPPADKPLTGEILAPAPVWAAPKKKLEPADYGFRALSIGLKAFGNQMPLEAALREMYGNDEATGIFLRAAVNPAQTTVAGWAAELVTTANGAWFDRLVAKSIYAPLSAAGARYDLGRNGTLKLPTRTTSNQLSGQWVGEGLPKPVKRLSLTTKDLKPHKLAVISTFTEEMAMYSTPAIEGIIRQAMTDDTQESLDAYLIDAVAESASRPAGLLNAANGPVTVPPSAAATASAAMVADLKGLIAAIVGNGGGTAIQVLMNPAQAMGIGFAQTTTGDFVFSGTDEAGRKFNVSFIVSRTIPAAKVIAVEAADFATATGDTPRFAVSNEATLHEDDAPGPISTVGTPNTVAAPIRSLFQTDSMAIRLSLYVTWIMRRTGMVASVNPVIW
jgi:HK97 family phage prohead protease